jgi:protein-disulfide isomerase
MANNENWVEERLSALEPPEGWRPDAAAALDKVRQRDRAHRQRARWMWSAMAASLMLLGVLLTPAKCALGVCRTPAATATEAVTAPSAAIETPVPNPAPQAGEAQSLAETSAQKPAPKPAAAAVETPAPVNFKESGNPSAPIMIEVFTDYQCPHCATIYDQIIPPLRAEYVLTGKVKLVHRDFPLPMHAYARLAARYANAAGAVGQYELVVNQIFRTQAIWAQSGDLDSLVAQVLSADQMERVRDLVRSDAHLDDGVEGDVAIARQNSLNQTPSLIVTYKGKHQVVAPIPPYSLLKSYLDELLTK